MTEQPDPDVQPDVDVEEEQHVPMDDDTVPERAVPVTEAPGTGNPAVDAVLRSLDRLDELPLAEHPGAFEQAHESLRAALSQARERPASGAGSSSEE